MKRNEIFNTIRNSDTNKVKFAIADIDGILRGKTISKEKFLEIADNSVGFCDVVFGWDVNDKCYNNSEITGWHTGYPDAKASIDLNTFRSISWDNDLPFFLADFSNTENYGSAACPRSILKKITTQASKLGYKPIFSQEFEWFNFISTSNELSENQFTKLKPISPGMFGYSMIRTGQYQDYFNALFDLLEKFNVQLEGIHTETGPGVYEAAIKYDQILNAADKAILFKNSVKEIAYKHGIIASFMAKWNADLPGCSGHIHQSLWNLEETKNLFFDPNADSHMSEIMENYLAGQLFCMPEILPMYAPTINSYKRLRDGAWAPITASWGFDNRTTAVRVINGQEKSSRLEMRLPGSDSNPYLGMAASLASGLYGIKNKLKLPEKVTGNAYAQENSVCLASNLMEATKLMQESSVAKELFGDNFVSHFCKTREWEWKEFSAAVTNWELKRYFEII